MMKQTIILFAIIMSFTSVFAASPITEVDNPTSKDRMFMDMAVTAASKSLEDGGLPGGAVVIMNGAWKGTGIPDGDVSAEENAIAKARKQSMSGAIIYTLNEPTADAYNAIMRSGAAAIYFANTRDMVIANGIYKADAYDDSKIDGSLTAVPLRHMTYPDAEAIIKKRK